MKNRLLIAVLALLYVTRFAMAADLNPVLTKPARKPVAAHPVVPATTLKPIANSPAASLATSPGQSASDKHKNRAVTSKDFSPLASPTPATGVQQVKVTPRQKSTATSLSPKIKTPVPTSPVPIPYPVMTTKPEPNTATPSATTPAPAKSKGPESTDPEH